MKKLFLLMLLAIATISYGRTPSQVSALLDRIGGKGTSARIETRVSKSLAENGQDVFEISSKKGKPFIQASSVSALTTGIGWYLNHYAHINLSWNRLTADMSKVAFLCQQKRKDASVVPTTGIISTTVPIPIQWLFGPRNAGSRK